jgi:TonB family protein
MTIVEAIYTTRKARPGAHFLTALAVAGSMHLGLVALAARAEPDLGAWSASLALRVHDELGREDVVTLEAPMPEAAHEPVTLAKASKLSAAAPKAAPSMSREAPAQAGHVLTSEGDAPVDFPGMVSGQGPSYAGGVTTQNGTSAHAVEEATSEDVSVAVRLAHEEWSCPWPDRATSDLIDEQSVVIKVLVREDGSAVDARIVRDAVGGFGEAALHCAKRTRFLPARERDGSVVRAWSPPIEVRFWR